jgi:outer membrane murein-binding lipoprotein Lpp
MDRTHVKAFEQMDHDKINSVITIKYSHFEFLNSNVLRLGSEVRDLTDENKKLKAEVERLRKHGDAMAEALEAAGFNNARDFWNAAKEGKQP